MPVEAQPIRPPVHPISEIPGHVFVLDQDPFTLLQQNPFFKTFPHGDDYLLEVTPHGQILIDNQQKPLNVGDAVNFFVDDTGRTTIVDTEVEQTACTAAILNHPENQMLFDALGNLTPASVIVDITIPGKSACTDGIAGQLNPQILSQVSNQETRRQVFQRAEIVSSFGKNAIWLLAGLSIPLLHKLVKYFQRGYRPDDIWTATEHIEIPLVREYESQAEMMLDVKLLEEKYGKDNVLVHRDGSVYIRGKRTVERKGKSFTEDIEQLMGKLTPKHHEYTPPATPYFHNLEHAQAYIEQKKAENPGSRSYRINNRIFLQSPGKSVDELIGTFGNLVSTPPKRQSSITS